jgi:hypothetical protein
MRIIEILSATSDQELNLDDPYALPIRIRDQDLMQYIANAFTGVERSSASGISIPPTNRLTQNHRRGRLHRCPMQLPRRFHPLALFLAHSTRLPPPRMGKGSDSVPRASAPPNPSLISFLLDEQGERIRTAFRWIDFDHPWGRKMPP